jgi:hypothetical protein
MRCEWEAIFQVSPGVSEPETIGEYHFFLDEEKRTCVKIEFSTESYRQQLPQRSHGSEYAEETICNEHIEKIKRLLLIRMIYQEYFEPINVVILKKPFLLNREELKKSGEKVTRPVEAFSSLGCIVIKTGDSLSEALIFYNQRAHLETKDDAVLRISRWLEWCESAPGEVEKFRILWAAFNSLFTICSKSIGKRSASEIERIEYTVGILINTNEADEILRNYSVEINKLIKFSNENGCDNKYKEFALWLDDLLKQSNNLCTIKVALFCVYCIRCDIFHDGPRIDNIEQKAEVARKLLAPVVTKCLHKMVVTKIE